MGIDKVFIYYILYILQKDVRYIIHYAIPSTLEGYYQESGRAGRDGLASQCIILYSSDDVKTFEFLCQRGDDQTVDPVVKIENLHSVRDYCISLDKCRHYQLLHYFGETLTDMKCKTQCDICTDLKSVTQDYVKSTLEQQTHNIKNNRISAKSLLERATQNSNDDYDGEYYDGGKPCFDTAKLLDKPYDDHPVIFATGLSLKKRMDLLAKGVEIRSPDNPPAKKQKTSIIKYLTLTQNDYPIKSDVKNDKINIQTKIRKRVGYKYIYFYTKKYF